MISFFAKPWFWGQGWGRPGDIYTIRVSSRIRGEEIAEHLGAKYNPRNGYENDICIYLKPRNLNNIKGGSYVDILDSPELLPMLKAKPELRVIAMSQSQYEFLKEEIENEIFFIPHHHVNFERADRKRNRQLIGGHIGPPSKITFRLYDTIREKLGDFITCYNYKTRQDVADFYQKIDFQVVWTHDFFDKNCPFRHPTKLINAASFGIPTIANRLAGYKEFEGYYLPIENRDEIPEAVERLRSNYNEWSEKVRIEAKKYHINEIAKLYRNLK